jgi:hypothetical protein
VASILTLFQRGWVSHLDWGTNASIITSWPALWRRGLRTTRFNCRWGLSNCLATVSGIPIRPRDQAPTTTGLVIVLLNDSVQLLGQNLDRFQRSGLSPAPKKFSELLPPEKFRRESDHHFGLATLRLSVDDEYFELTIPKQLYLDWQTCFIFHRLSLESRRQNQRSPVWLDGERISAVSASSIDKTNVLVDKGEMSFALFEYKEGEIMEIIDANIRPLQKLKAFAELLGETCVPGYLINYIENFCPLGDKSIAMHPPMSISGYTEKDGEMDKATITRTKGFIGKSQMEVTKYPDAIHHINIFINDTGKARLFYKYSGSVRFLKAAKR